MVGWVRLESLPTGAVLAGKYHWGQSAQPNAAYRLSVRPGRRLVFIVSPNGEYLTSYSLAGDTALAMGQWHHVAAVFDAAAGQMRIYLDGDLEAAKTVSYHRINVTDEAFYLAANVDSSDAVAQHLDGALDEWQIYAEPLSESQIETLMAQTR